MSGAGGAAGEGGLYGDPSAAGFFNPFDHGDVDSFFFRRSPCAGGGGDGLAAPYSSSITGYLQGFLQDDDDDVKPEMAVHQAVSSGQHDVDQLAGGASVAPPSSSAMSSSSEAGGGGEPRRRGCKKGTRPAEEEEIDDDDDEGSAADRNSKKRSKAEKQTKARQPRVAFKTKSEVDHLEDGYRWRKYGQKAVKNSSYPRSYYRCTAARCGVKKLVERSQEDPSSVITTYEGQHTHPSPVGLAARAGRLVHDQSPLQLGFSPSQAMMHHGFMASGILPAGSGMPVHLLQQQEQYRSSSWLAATYGGALGFVPSSAMGDVKEHDN